jgi:hypothetical protein
MLAPAHTLKQPIKDMESQRRGKERPATATHAYTPTPIHSLTHVRTLTERLKLKLTNTGTHDTRHTTKSPLSPQCCTDRRENAFARPPTYVRFRGQRIVRKGECWARGPSPAWKMRSFPWPKKHHTMQDGRCRRTEAANKREPTLASSRRVSGFSGPLTLSHAHYLSLSLSLYLSFSLTSSLVGSAVNVMCEYDCVST